MNDQEDLTEICPLCGGHLESGKTTFTVDFGKGVVVIRNVPALVCDQCGADWLDDDITDQIEEIVEEARANHRMIEVRSLSA